MDQELALREQRKMARFEALRKKLEAERDSVAAAKQHEAEMQARFDAERRAKALSIQKQIAAEEEALRLSLQLRKSQITAANTKPASSAVKQQPFQTSIRAPAASASGSGGNRFVVAAPGGAQVPDDPPPPPPVSQSELNAAIRRLKAADEQFGRLRAELEDLRARMAECEAKAEEAAAERRNAQFEVDRMMVLLRGSSDTATGSGSGSGGSGAALMRQAEQAMDDLRSDERARMRELEYNNAKMAERKKSRSTSVVSAGAEPSKPPSRTPSQSTAANKPARSTHRAAKSARSALQLWMLLASKLQRNRRRESAERELVGANRVVNRWRTLATGLVAARNKSWRTAAAPPPSQQQPKQVGSTGTATAAAGAGGAAAWKRLIDRRMQQSQSSLSAGLSTFDKPNA